MKNRIYFYSGTGNSLKAAKDIAETLNDCEIVAITKDTTTEIVGELERIGVVYPVYYQGLPGIVADFISKIKIQSGNKPYIFAIATYGLLSGNSLPQLNKLLEARGAKLDYGQRLQAFSNCVSMYEMKKEVEKITDKTDKEIQPLIKAIQEKRTNQNRSFNKLIDWYYRKQINMTAKRGTYFNVDETCTSCGICRKVCAVKNIDYKDGKLVFQDKCQQCMACIQYCPKRAINYKNATQSRRRYTHPLITYKELSRFYN